MARPTPVTRALVRTKKPLGPGGVIAAPPERPRTADVVRMRAGDATAAMDGLQNVVAQLGEQTRDKRTGSTYTMPAPLSQFEVSAMMRSSWLARRIVRTPADDMTREGWTISWDQYDAKEKNAKAIATAEKTFQVRAKMNTGVAWGRGFGGAGVVIGIRGDTDMSKPLVIENIRKGSLQFLHVMDRWRLSATGIIDTDANSPNFGKPLYYAISDSLDPKFRVHWSRIIIFGGEPVDYWSWQANGYWDDSVLQHLAETIKDYDATLAGVASMVWEANVDILKTPLLRDLLAKDGGEQKVIDRMLLAVMGKSFNRMMILDGGDGTPNSKGEEYSQKIIQFAGLRDVIEKFMINVCGAADIPMTRLFGQSPAGLTATGESDIRNYYDRLKSAQENILRPPLERLYEILVRSVLGKMPENFTLEFNPLWQMSDKEQAEVEFLQAQRDEKYLDQGVLTEGAVARELLDRKTYRTLTAKDVALAEKMTRISMQSAEQAAQNPPPGVSGTPAAPGAEGAARPPGAAAGGAPAHQTPNDDGKQGTPRARDSKLRGVRVGDEIKKQTDGWHVYSQGGDTHLGGPYRDSKAALARLREVEAHKVRDISKNDPSGIVGRKTFAGFKIAIENQSGSVRTFRNDDGSGTHGHVVMANDYGFFEDYCGADGEELDCYLGHDEKADKVYVIHQLKKGTRDFDEDKVVLGVRSPDEALKVYATHRDDGLESFGGMNGMRRDDFAARLTRRRGTGKIRS